MRPLLPLMFGMLAMGYLIAATFFFRFWRRTHDSLFAFFAAAFILLAGQRIASVLTDGWVENTALLYLPRLVAFLLILAAIISKNRKAA